MTKNPNLQIQREPTRKQLSRAEREAKQRRRIWLGVFGVLGLAALILVSGYLYQTVFSLNEPVANVNGEIITTRQFQARVRLDGNQVQQQIQVAYSLNDQNSLNYYVNQLSDPVTYGGQIINGMVDDLLLKQAAPTFGVSVSAEEVQLNIEKQLRYDRNPPTPAPPTSTPSPAPTASGPITQTPTPTLTPFPTATPVTYESFTTTYKSELTQLASLGFGEQEYRDLIQTSLLVNKVRTAIEATVVTTTDQIKFQYVRAANADAVTVTKDINAQGFGTIYQAVLSGTYPITTVQATETTEWVPHDEISATTELGPVLADTLFATPVSQTVAVINAAGTATYVALILDHQVQPLSASFLQSRQQAAVDDWLAQRRKPEFYLTWNDRVPVIPIPTPPPSSGSPTGP
jgi:SurA N-terminal domain